MATLDDKLLGEKLHYYCSSSSEGEDDDDEGGSKEENQQGPSSRREQQTPGTAGSWQGTSCNTGPKGVIKDFQRFKQLEREQAEDRKEELARLAAKFSITCRTNAEDDKDKAEQELEDELAQLMDESCIQQFVQQRMQEMLEKQSQRRRFGAVQLIKDGEQFLSAVEKEEKGVLVVVLLHEPNVAGCPSALKSLEILATEHIHVKFCLARPSWLSMSANFKSGGVPALLAYRDGQLVGNWIKITDELGDEFGFDDFESYLVEHGVLNDRQLVPPIGPSNQDDEDDEN